MGTERDAVRVADDVLWQRVEGRVALVSLASGRYYVLDETASRIWETLLGQRALPDAIAHLEHIFDVEAATLCRDVGEFVDEMAKAGLLCRSERPTAPPAKP